MIEIKERNSNCERFRDIFHFELKDVAEIEIVPDKEYQQYQKTMINLNIFKFEKKMKERGYKKWSINEYVENEYWKEASVLIDKLL